MIVRFYKNSFLASLVSVVGYLMAGGGILAIFEGGVGAGIVFIAVGIALAVWGKNISDNKAFKTWWKQVSDAGLEDVIKRDLNTAIQIYNKNPQTRTLKKIEELNPSAAQYIREHQAKK